MTTRIVLLLVACMALAAILSACASPPGGGQLSYSGYPGPPDARIEVDASGIPPERQAAFREQGGAQRIATGVAAELSASPKQSAEGAYAIKITVMKFRLRSTSSGLWFGAMAGPDVIGVNVVVESDGKVLRKFSSDTTTAVAGVIRPGATNRFVRLVNELSRRIVAEL